jgi:hypothetical protein
MKLVTVVTCVKIIWDLLLPAFPVLFVFVGKILWIHSTFTTTVVTNYQASFTYCSHTHKSQWALRKVTTKVLYRKFSDQPVCFLHVESPRSEEPDKERVIRPVWHDVTSLCNHKVKTTSFIITSTNNNSSGKLYAYFSLEYTCLLILTGTCC